MTAQWNHRLRTVLCCTVLEIGALFGVPMRVEEIERLLRNLSAPQIVQTIPEEDEESEAERQIPD